MRMPTARGAFAASRAASRRLLVAITSARDSL
jgi:hypothetical protein